MSARTRINPRRISKTTDQTNSRPFFEDGVLLKAQFKHLRTSDYASTQRLHYNDSSAQCEARKRATKSCDNIYAQQMKCDDSAFKWRDSTRSEEQLCPPPQTGARSRLSALLKKLSPRPLRSKSQPIPWVVVEFSDTKKPLTNQQSLERLSHDRLGSVSDNSYRVAMASSEKQLGMISGKLYKSQLARSGEIVRPNAVPQISVVSSERPKRLYETNKSAKPRSNRSYGHGGSVVKTERLKVACRPHSLLLPPSSGDAHASQRRMASYESIGSCSLDVDITVSDSASELCRSGSASEQTLHSLNLSSKTGDSTKHAQATTPEYVKRTAKLFETTDTNGSETALDGLADEIEARRSTLHHRINQSNILTEGKNTEIRLNGTNGEVAKKPSYLGLACSISGYTTITNYDSKLREGFRSRDHSPGRLVIKSRDASPLRFNQDHIDRAALYSKSDCGNFLVAPPTNGRTVNGSSLSKVAGAANGDVRSKDARTLPSGHATNGDMSSGSDKRDATAGTTLRESSRNFMSTMLSTNSYTSTSYEVTSSFQSQVSNFESPTRNLLKNGAHDFNGSLSHTTNGSPIKSRNSFENIDNLSVPDGCSLKKSPGAVRVVEFTSQSKNYVQNGQNDCKTSYKFSESKNQFLESKPQTSEHKSSFTSTIASGPKIATFAKTSEPKVYQHGEQKTESRGYSNGNGGSIESTSIWTGGVTNNKSFIQQRVERLYGPGALAQGFFRRTSSGQSSSSRPSEQGGVNECNLAQQSALPVLRHLRPEFRAQLSLGSSRKAVDGPVTKIIPILQQQVSIESVTDILPAAPEVVLPIEQATPVIVQSEASQVKDGAYYLTVLKAEIDAINVRVAQTERDMEAALADIPEEALGKLRAVIGQARLLVKQKLQQFEGLCHKNMAQSTEEPFPTTTDDLAGFWDMVKLQVCQVHGLFTELDALKQANWREEEVPVADVVDSGTPSSATKRRSARPVKATPSPANEEARKAREEARRKMMEERRREMREKNKQKTEEVVEIFVPQENGNET